MSSALVGYIHAETVVINANFVSPTFRSLWCAEITRRRNGDPVLARVTFPSSGIRNGPVPTTGFVTSRHVPPVGVCPAPECQLDKHPATPSQEQLISKRTELLEN